MNATALKLNFNSIGSEQHYELVIADESGAFVGKNLLVNGIAAAGPATALTKSIAKGHGEYADEPIGRTSIPFTRTEANRSAIRDLKRIAPGSTIDLAEVRA